MPDRVSLFQPRDFDLDACANGFRRIFIGFLIVGIDINLNQIDIIFDWAGWIAIAVALNSMIDASPRIGGMRALALIFTAESFAEMFVPQLRASIVRGNFTLTYAPGLAGIVAFVSFVLLMIFMWQYFALIMELAQILGRSDIHEKAVFRRNLFLGSLASLLLIVPIAFIAPPLGMGLGIICILAALVAAILTLTLALDAARMCEDANPTPYLEEFDPHKPLFDQDPPLDPEPGER